MEGRLAAARRLCEVRRRHGPGERAGPADEDPARASRPQLPPAARLAAVPDRARRADGQFPVGDRDLRGFLRLHRDAATPNVIGGVAPGSPAASGGHPRRRPNPVGRTVARRRQFEDVQRIVVLRPGERVPIAIERGSERVTLIESRSESDEQQDRFGQKFSVGLLGVLGSQRTFERLRRAGADPAAAGYTIKVTRIDDRRPVADHQRAAIDQGPGRADQDRADRRPAGDAGRSRVRSAACAALN